MAFKFYNSKINSNNKYTFINFICQGLAYNGIIWFLIMPAQVTVYIYGR